MRTQNMCSVSLLAIVAAMGVSAGVARAAPGGEPSAQVEEIVVTARKRAEGLQDVPISITAVTSEVLAQRGVQSLDQLSQVAPNLNFQQAGANPGVSFIGMRGQQAATINPTSDPPVTIYIDGVASMRGFGLQSALVDVNRVEVLHGPQGTLFGKNTTGGALSIITKAPGDRFGGYVTGEYGNYDYAQVTGAMDVPFGDKAALRLVANRSRHDGYAHSTNSGEDLSTDRHWSLRGHLVLKPTESLKVDLIGDAYRSSNGLVFSRVVSINPALASTGGVAAVGGAGFGMVSDAAVKLFGADTADNRAKAVPVILANYGWPPQGGKWTNGYASGPDGRFETTGAVLNVEWNPGELTIRSITGWRSYYERSSYVLNPSPYGFANVGGNITEGDFYSEELQVLGSALGDRLKYVAGIYGSYEDDTPIVRAGTPDKGGHVRNSSTAGFFQGDYKIASNLTFTGGVRYTEDVRYIRESLAPPCATVFSLNAQGVCTRRRKDSFPGWGYLASLDWKPTSDVMLYVKASRAYIAGGYNPGTTSTGPASDYDSETLINYEVGLKSEWLDHRVRFNAAAFWAKDTNLQRLVIVPSGVGSQTLTTPVINNAGKARIPGLEAELTAKPSAEWTLTAALGRVWPKYLEFSEVGPNGTRVSLLDSPWPTPKLTYSVSAHYVRATDWGQAIADVSWSGQNGYNTCISRCLDKVGPRQSGFGLLNANVGVDLKALDLSITAFGRNLLNKQYLTATIGLDGIFPLGYNEGLVGAPRTYGVRVTKRFGG